MSYWRDKKVLVTGGAGFIGSYLCELLVQEGAEVTVADNLVRGTKDRLDSILDKVHLKTANLYDFRNCLKVCQGQQVVLSLAAKVTGIEYNRFNMADMFESNMTLQINVLRAAHESGIKRFLQVSTACIYPHDAKVPTPESEGDRGTPEPTNEGYGWAKRMGEKLALYYVREKGMEVKIARPFNAYGPRDHYDEATSHVIPALIKRVLDGEDPVAIWGSGNQSRAFVHAKDFARGLMLVAEKAPAGVPINVGHDQEVTIKELFAIICKVIGKTPKPKFDTSKPDGYPRRAADTTLLRKYTGFVPSISLEEGIREMVEALRPSPFNSKKSSSTKVAAKR
ncbi:MAG: NAD-dependent epimerase/dehydratase family protein [Candidatus Omnitrophica bacterium]|nr:NAD-dependent epimerase/dehydratase family protein [Candidatus Omnitrophota bacterium]